MRNAFAKNILELAKSDPKIRLIVGDIGFKIFDEFRQKFPDRFLNCGIAEQNMISVAAGMASEGLRPVVYTIIPFLIMRAYEQIRVDIGINSQGLILIGVGGGLAYDKLGPTHHAYEDIALMKCIPRMNIFTPYDPESTVGCLNQANEKLHKGLPSYIRLCKGGEPDLEKLEQIGENIFLLKGKINNKNIIFTHGAISSRIIEIISSLELNISVFAITSMSEEELFNISELIKLDASKVCFIEENFDIGSLYYSFIAKYFSLHKNINFKSLTLPKKYIFEIYDREYLINKFMELENSLKNFFNN